MASTKAPIEAHIAIASAPESGPDVYRNVDPIGAQEGQRSVFGGFLVSQALSAASATVPDSFHPYSSQSSFIAAAAGKEKIVYRVERISDGRNFLTRIVRASQGTTSVYVAVISFQALAGGNQLNYGAPMIELDGTPEDIDPSAMQSFQTSMVDRSTPIMQQKAEDRPLDWRPHSLEMSDDPTNFRVRGFVRSTPLSTNDSAVHLAALAYASDDLFFGIALAANPIAVGKGWRNVALAASLTHNVSFHDPHAKIDEWIVLERETSWGANGRVMVHQKMWNRQTGKLILSGSQEALVRLHGSKI
ncbi:Thioesterase/thiol ester dehydrase-isomerase [Xylaria sp. FL0933]|nr:Thioesterase/thiol ester dehydrase-isomerase [Xylaria sp. FL0933]